MLQVLREQKKVLKKLSLCQLDFHNCSRVQESLGLVFYYTDLQEQERVSWRRLAPLSVTLPSSVFPLVIWWVNGRESLRDLSSSYLSSPEKGSRLWSLSMRSTHSVVRELRERTRAPGELRLSSSCKWTAVETVKREFLSWGQLIPLGNLMKLSGEDSKRGSIFICLMLRLGLECSSWRSREFLILCQNKILLI